jgi:exodeoxyribonuclease V alpha subunit
MNELLAALRAWVEAGWLREVDHAFAAFLASQAPDAPARGVLAAALASHQLGRGHVCLDLGALAGDAKETLALPPDEDEAVPDAAHVMLQEITATPLDNWLAALQDTRLVGTGEGATPLVLAGTRLYLRRYWQHERSVRRAIEARLSGHDEATPLAQLRPALELLFARNDDDGPDWQKVACALAARSRFAVVTGGPGTGKTTTVVKLLALLQHLAPVAADGRARRLRIRLAAPTGKAAARLNESIASAVDRLPLAQLGAPELLRAAIPSRVETVHRLLGGSPLRGGFRHDEHHPLPLDVLVLDEASMVGLEAMAALVAALPAHARLVLLGDKDQLASVEAGGLLGELCRRADDGHFLPATARWVGEATGEVMPAALVDTAGEPLDQAVVKLRRSHRFDAKSGIGRLAEAVNAGDVSRVRHLREQGSNGVAWRELTGDAALRPLVLDGGAEDGRAGLRHYLEVVRAERPAPDVDPSAFDAWAARVLSAYSRFQLLCAVRRGPHGVERMNERVAQLLHREGLIPDSQGWYAGRPVMVTGNDYSLGLMNGDVGVALELPGPHGRPVLRVAFPSGEGTVRWVLPSRLLSVETVFAMTVHKSQGSEFEHVALLLPERDSRVLTRELVYTGITRARRWFTVAGSAALLEEAVRRPTRRSGGLLLH